MKRKFGVLLFALLAVACINEPEMGGSTVPQAKIIGSSSNAAEGVLIVRLASANTTISVEGVELEPMFPANGSDMDCWYLLRFDKSKSLDQMAQHVASLEGVEVVEFSEFIKRPTAQHSPMPESRPEVTRAVEYPFDDPELPWQWHYYNDGSLADYIDVKAGADINLLNAWKYTAGDNRVIVAVVDGGIMTNHRDLADNMWVNHAEKNGAAGVDDDGNGYVDDVYGWNCVYDNGNITPDSHGTHVAGTISAVNNNGYAVCGIAGGTGNGDGVRLMSIQIFDGNEGCYAHQIAKGIRYAADNGAAIANNSWGYSPYDYDSDSSYERDCSVLQEAIEYFKTNGGLEGVMEGGLMIFAAGNESVDHANYPGAYHSNVCVAAFASDFAAAYYTNYGPGTNLCAPGGDLLYGTLGGVSSTSVEYANSDGYEYMQGTSMATPHVSGCAALGLSYALKQGYHFTVDEFRNKLITSVHNINTYMTGTRSVFDFVTGSYLTVSLDKYKNKMGTGYIDAHLLLMQLDSTPCLYLSTGVETSVSLEEYFGDGAEDITYQGVEISDDVKSMLGITSAPTVEKGMLTICCNKSGVGRMKVKAIAGGSTVGGGNNMGGMLVEREFEVVVRGSVAANGGWL